MSTFSFSYHGDDDEAVTIEMTIHDAVTHMDVTAAYMRFLRACGFYIGDAIDRPDVNDLTVQANENPAS